MNAIKGIKKDDFAPATGVPVARDAFTTALDRAYRQVTINAVEFLLRRGQMDEVLKSLTLSGWAEQIGETKLRSVLAEAGIGDLYFQYALGQRACVPTIYQKLSISAIQQCDGVFPTFERATIACSLPRLLDENAPGVAGESQGQGEEAAGA